MEESRTSPSYNVLQKRIAEKLKETLKTLKELGYKSLQLSPREFYDYLTGETPTGDTITIVDVLGNDFLMIHEVVEMSELKKIGIPINKNTVMMFHPEVYGAHYTATEHELNFALSKKEFDWLRVRIGHAKSWLEDDSMPQHLVPRCKAIIKRFSKHQQRGA